MKMKKLIKALFSRRKEDANGRLIKDFATIERLCEKGLLGIDFSDKPYINIGASLHMMLSDDELKLARWPYRWLDSWGLVARDRRYLAFMKKVRMYINFRRRALTPKPMRPLPPDATLLVAIIAADKKEILLVGAHHNDTINFNEPVTKKI